MKALAERPLETELRLSDDVMDAVRSIAAAQDALLFPNGGSKSSTLTGSSGFAKGPSRRETLWRVSGGDRRAKRHPLDTLPFPEWKEAYLHKLAARGCYP